MKELLEDHGLIVMEGAVVERLRRSGEVELDPLLANAPLIYDESGKAALAGLYQGYIDIALGGEIPFLMCSPTWRANRERISRSGVTRSINRDAVTFMRGLRSIQPGGEGAIYIGGMVGCKNDCYDPTQGLCSEKSQDFHGWQVDQLGQAGVDFLIGVTLPSVGEALGIARAMASTGKPYIISFVISRNGCVLDGTELPAAVDMIDSQTHTKPLGYMFNCAYPTFLCAQQQPEPLFERLIGCQTNGSSLDQCDLDGADELLVESISDWGENMLRLNRSYGLQILGGCCGTGEEHLGYIVQGSMA